MVLRRFLFAVALAAFSLAAAAQGRTEELMRKSGLWDQVAQMRVQRNAGAAPAIRGRMEAQREQMVEYYAERSLQT